MIGLINFRLPINSYFFFNKILKFSNFYLESIFNMQSNSQIISILGYDAYDTNVLKIAGPFFQLIISLVIIHFIAKFLYYKII